MPMQKIKPAESPAAYVAALTGWRRERVEQLRAAVRGAAKLEETIKWGHLVYLSNGPVLLIRAEDQRVLFGFWRGKRLRSIEERLRASGKYEMATLEFREGTAIDSAVARKLAKAAAALNKSVGDPTLDAKPKKIAKKKAAKNTGAKRKRD